MPTRRRPKNARARFGRSVPSYNQLIAQAQAPTTTRARAKSAPPSRRWGVRMRGGFGAGVDSQLLNAFQQQTQQNAKLSALQSRHEGTMRDFEARLREQERNLARTRGTRMRPEREMDGDYDMGEDFGARAARPAPQARARAPPPPPAPMSDDEDGARAARPPRPPAARAPPPARMDDDGARAAKPAAAAPPAPMDADDDISPARAIQRPARREEAMSAPAEAIKQPARRDEGLGAPGGAIVPYVNVERNAGLKREQDEGDEHTATPPFPTRRKTRGRLTDIARAGLVNSVDVGENAVKGDDNNKGRAKHQRVNARLPGAKQD